MRRQEDDKLYQLLQPVISGMGYELLGIERQPARHGSLVRLYIDSAQGITVDDCSRVSRQVDGVLQVEQLAPDLDTLEVSSPGLDRPLFSLEQCRRFIGEKVKVQTTMMILDRRRITGELTGIEDGKLIIVQDGNEYQVPFELVDRVRLVFSGMTD